MLWSLIHHAVLQLTPPPESGAIDRWVIYTLAGAIVAMVVVVVSMAKLILSQSNNATKKAEEATAEWKTTAKESAKELFETHRTIARAIDTLERQGVLVEALSKDLAAVKADGIEIRRMVTGLEQEVRALRDTAGRSTARRTGGD